MASLREFAAAVDEYAFPELALDGGALEGARETLARTGTLVVGEPHGARETPGVLYVLASILGTRALGFEWVHEEMEAPVQEFLRTGGFDFTRLWQLPASSEFFCGDGRITAGHFALLQRLREEGRLDRVIAFDRLDPEPPLEDWQARDREMPSVADGTTMAAHLARALPGLSPAMLDYAEGHLPMPDAPIRFRVPRARPAVLPAP